MHAGRTFYRMLDDRTVKTPAIAIGSAEVKSTWTEASTWNEKSSYGIFWTVNEFKNHFDRKKENLKRIISWTADIDDGTKKDQAKLIAKFPEPSLVVETKNGFHVYYNAIDAKPENYELIETKFIVPSLGADMNARDLSRILRAPCFYHLKDLNNPFFCKVVHTSEAAYTEKQMMKLFDDHREEEKSDESQKKHLKRSLKFNGDDSLWKRIWDMDCEHGLSVLSGTDSVGGETYDFKRNSNGNKNIIVDNKSTSCFIDKHGRIGSTDGGGPTIAAWINWFHKDWKKTVKILKQHFPEVFK